MKLYEQMALPNGLTAEVYDLSRPIAANTTKVEMVIKISMKLQPNYFVEPTHFEQTKKIFGPDIVFEHHMERSFVLNADVDDVTHALLGTFKKDSLPYLSSSIFPARFAQSKYRDIVKNPYKYQKHSEDDPS
jgi:hypothetical protein